MSELSAAAAAALGIPEAIVERSAAARATETGMTVDEVLEVWAGGGDIPTAAAPPIPEEVAEEPEAAEAAPDEGVPPSPPPAVLPPAGEETVPPSPAAPSGGETVSGKPPVLVGEADNPMAVLVGVVALFVAVFLVGLVGPALPAENPGARSSELPYSEAALRGQHVYQSVGCASCHTQMARPVVADVGLGAVTLNDSNQVLGSRRFGPDLSDVGSRVSASQIEGVITGLGEHPSLSLSPGDLDDLVAYLLESQTMEAAPEEPADEEGAAEEEPAES